MKARIFTLILLYILLLKNAYAYLDPSTGSMIIQSAIAMFAGALYTGKVYWTKITLFFFKISKKNK
jgi:hypothetical protein